MSFSFYDGDPVAKIMATVKNETSKSSKKEDIPIYFKPLGFDDDEEEGDYDDIKTSIKLKPKAGVEFQLIPNNKKNKDNTIKRHVGYITGQSGSGKTTFVINYLKQYRMMFKNNPIYLFSAIGNEGDKDPYNIKELEVERIKIDEKIKELNARDFHDSCVIFDDMDCYKDKKVLELVVRLRDEMLETGRHAGTFVLITYHLPTNAHDTRRMINEASFVVYFPKLSNGKIKNLLENYLGLEKNQIKAIKRMPTRWACILRTTPNILMTQKELKVLDDDDLED